MLTIQKTPNLSCHSSGPVDKHMAQCQYYLDRETTRFLLRFRRNPYFPDDNVDGISKFLGR